LSNYFNKEFWVFFNTFAPWLSAIGTISAVIVSLYLARRDKTVRLQVSAGHRILVIPGMGGPREEYMVIQVVNIGHREAQITGIGWEVGLFYKEYAMQPVLNDEFSSPLPVRLKDGEEANYYYQLYGDSNWLTNFSHDFLLHSPKKRSKYIKLVVFTSIGKNFKQIIEEGLRKKLVETAIKMKKD